MCEDCGRPYPFGLDTILPQDQWKMLGAGLLCASCIVVRASKLPGVVSTRMRLVFDARELATIELPEGGADWKRLALTKWDDQPPGGKAK